MIKKSVVIVCREESLKDFEDIARRARRLDTSIAVIILPNIFHSSQIPKYIFNLPMLVIYLVNPPINEFKSLKKISVKRLDKLEQFERYLDYGLPCLPIEAFKWGMHLSKEQYGNYVVLKPQNIQSTGKDINMIPTHSIGDIELKDFPTDHLIHKDSYYVQKFIHTDLCATHFRVIIFLNQVLSSIKSISRINLPKEDTPLHILLNTSVASNNQEYRDIELFEDETIINFALHIASKFSDIPLLGIDILKDSSTNKLYVLELNAGGNTWAFSSAIASHFRESVGGRKKLIQQYNAWDRAAEAIILKTNQLAQ